MVNVPWALDDNLQDLFPPFLTSSAIGEPTDVVLELLYEHCRYAGLFVLREWLPSNPPGAMSVMRAQGRSMLERMMQPCSGAAMSSKDVVAFRTRVCINFTPVGCDRLERADV